MTRAEEYVLLRLEGKTAREASRAVGFAGDRPSPQARDLHRRAKEILETPAIADAIKAQRARLDADAEKLRRARAAVKAWEVASALARYERVRRLEVAATKNGVARG